MKPQLVASSYAITSSDLSVDFGTRCAKYQQTGKDLQHEEDVEKANKTECKYRRLNRTNTHKRKMRKEI